MKIVSAEIKKNKWVMDVIATFEDGTVKTIFNYYPDEISFREDEFVGLTEYQACELFHKKDISYLQS